MSAVARDEVPPFKCLQAPSVMALPDTRARNGFSLVEHSVVVVIIGVLATFGVPRFLQNAERGKASESFKYLASVRAAQEKYQTVQGTYASDISMLDLDQISPTYFTVGQITATDGGCLKDSWSLTLTRCGRSSVYGAYTVTFTQEGYDPRQSSIAADISPPAI